MFTPGDPDFGGADQRVGAGWPQPSPRLVALASTLNRMLAASDRVTEALTRHDRLALEATNALTSKLVAEAELIADTLTDEDRSLVPGTVIPELRARLGEASRRNAVLIEQAWAVDAALMRLMIGGGRPNAESATAGYATSTGPAYVDRGA